MTATQEREVLFSGPMVRAILDGTKTQTRRVMKPQPDDATDLGLWAWSPRKGVSGYNQRTAYLGCPYGVPGDRLWVRETWADVNTESGPALMYRADSEVRNWRDFSTKFGPDYGAGPSMDYDSYAGDYTMWWSDLHAGAPGHRWRPSIHMPRWASRLTLEVAGVRVERVQNISEADARAEGCECASALAWDSAVGASDPYAAAVANGHRAAFRKLWDSLNGRKEGSSWKDNPWVWVVECRKVEA